ncbi:MAG: transposase, partial [Candidatus Binatia bacterium]
TTRLIPSTANANFAWQRNYYEHVIRDEQSLDHIRQYILDNPVRRDIDRDNPQATTFEPENT